MKQRARAMREEFGLCTPRVLRSHLRRIFRAFGVELVYWPGKFKRIHGAYFSDEYGTTVMLERGLPEEPMIFTMAHELKHHLVDQSSQISCNEITPATDYIEKGAEVFAAELIFPEQDFLAALEQLGVKRGACCQRDLVVLKHETKTTMHYASLTKRAEFLGIAPEGTIPRTGWKKLEERLYGIPLYKQLRQRRR